MSDMENREALAAEQSLPPRPASSSRMSAEFRLESSRWYTLMKTGSAARNARTCAEDVTKWAARLCNFEYEPTAGAELAKAEDALTEALLAVQIARASYERVTAGSTPPFWTE